MIAIGIKPLGYATLSHPRFQVNLQLHRLITTGLVQDRLGHTGIGQVRVGWLFRQHKVKVRLG